MPDNTYVGVRDEEEQMPEVTPDGLLEHRIHEVRAVEARPVVHDRTKCKDLRLGTLLKAYLKVGVSNIRVTSLTMPCSSGERPA